MQIQIVRNYVSIAIHLWFGTHLNSKTAIYAIGDKWDKVRVLFLSTALRCFNRASSRSLFYISSKSSST